MPRERRYSCADKETRKRWREEDEAIAEKNKAVFDDKQAMAVHVEPVSEGSLEVDTGADGEDS